MGSADYARYWANPEIERERSRNSKKANAQRICAYLAEYVDTHPCIDCGERDPIVLEFDHRDPAAKRWRISQMRTGKYRFETFLEELQKCDVRCANCHRRHTHRQREAGLIACGKALAA